MNDHTCTRNKHSVIWRQIIISRMWLSTWQPTCKCDSHSLRFYNNDSCVKRCMWLLVAAAVMIPFMSHIATLNLLFICWISSVSGCLIQWCQGRWFTSLSINKSCATLCTDVPPCVLMCRLCALTDWCSAVWTDVPPVCSDVPLSDAPPCALTFHHVLQWWPGVQPNLCARIHLMLSIDADSLTDEWQFDSNRLSCCI